MQTLISYFFIAVLIWILFGRGLISLARLLRPFFFPPLGKWEPQWSPLDGEGDIYTVKIFKNGGKMWWDINGVATKIRYSNGDVILFRKDGTVFQVIDHNGIVYNYGEK